MISSGPNGAAASKVLCSVIGNVLRSPDEPKYRQLKWCVVGPSMHCPDAAEQLSEQRFNGEAIQLSIPVQHEEMIGHPCIPALSYGCTCKQHGVPVAATRFAGCSANARVASTLAIPGVMDLLLHLGFEHIADTSNEASTSSATPSAFDPSVPSGIIQLPMQYPGQDEPLFHGALSLLRPLVADSATGTLPEADISALPVNTQAIAARYQCLGE